jgi:hypothetical protein
VKRHARVIPFEAAISQNPPDLSPEILDQAPMINIENCACRQDIVPMLHQMRIASPVATELAEIIGEGIIAAEKFGKAR